MRAFEAAARLQSVTRAAEELHVTHGAISRHIRALEAELGAPLFKRAGRGVALTRHGRILGDAASAAFEQLRQGCAQVRHGAVAAPFVLGCSGSILARWMIPRLDRMRRDLPALQLNVAVIEQAPDPDMAGLDAALVLGDAPWPRAWQVQRLAPERIAPVFSPQHPRAAPLRTGDLEALVREPLLHTASRPQAWSAWARAQRISIDSLHLGQAFDHLYYMLEASLAGLGIAIAPEPLVAADIASGRLLAPWRFRATSANWVLCAAKSSRDPRLAALATWLRTELQARPSLTAAKPRNSAR